MNWKGCGRKCLWSDSPEKTEEKNEIVTAKIRTGHLQDLKAECVCAVA